MNGELWGGGATAGRAVAPSGERRTDCPVCGSDAIRFLEIHEDRRKGLVGRWEFWTCTACSVAFQNPMPTSEELLSYYATYDDDVPLVFGAGPGTRYTRLRRFLHRLTGDVDPRDFVPLRPALRILDFGCGRAPYLLDFHARGAQVAGAEIASDVVAAYQHRGFDVRQIHDLERIPFEDACFDVVYLMQVIEHIRHPHRFLDELFRILKPGGAAYFALPDGESWGRRVFGADWVTGWFAPFHLFVYTTKSFGRLAAAHGFDMVDWWSVTPESWCRLNVKARLRPKARRIEKERIPWLDALPTRLILACTLRAVECFRPHGDCLVVHVRRRP